MPLVKATSQQVNAYDLASQWLTALGWPNTPSNQRALAAWFMAESSRHGNNVTVVGNNPLNITTSTGPYRLVGTHKIAVYSTPQEGINAFGSLIKSPNHNYPGIRTAFLSGKNGQTVVSAIINSGWVPGGNGPSYYHTVNGQRSNLLQSIFNGLAGGSSNATLASAPDTSRWQEILKSLGISTDPNYVLTAEDAKKIADVYVNGSVTLGIKPQLPKDDYDNIVAFFTGKTVAQAFSGGSIGPVPTIDPLGPIAGAIGAGVAAILGAILPVAAMIGGGVLSLFGLYLITKEATSGTSAESIVSPVPVFIRERT
jgi:hypothetical protein